jgi:hypothetical protein
MNVKFSNDSLRFRISTDELEAVLLTGNLIGATPLPPDQSGGTGIEELRYEIEVGAFVRPLSLRHAGDKLSLLVSREALIKLAATVPSKEGLTGTENIGPVILKLALEIDLKKRKDH